MAQFGNPIDNPTKKYLIEDGFGDARTRAVGCMGWIWSQWLSNVPTDTFSGRVESFVERGMEMQKLSAKFYMRPLHDLYLLHCAIFCSPEAQLKQLADCVVDSSGYGEYKPLNNGELYVSAWTGMLKYRILGDRNKATEQSEIIWKANRESSCRTSTKSLVAPWLAGNWKRFVECQKKDFESLWGRAAKDGTIICRERAQVIIDMDMVSSVQQLWCWAHGGMALLAYREGVDVATDPFWLPTLGLK